MSLLLWFPLDGNLNNQGIAEQPDFTGTTAQYGTGKLGAKALYVNQAQISANVPELIGVTKFSICYWYKIDTSITNITNYADFWQVQAKVGDTTTIIRDELRKSDLIGQNRAYVIKDPTIGSNTNTYYAIMSGHNSGADKWCHVAITKDDDYVKAYINGDLVRTTACSNFESSPQTLTGYFQFGNTSTSVDPVYLQDWRLYDHVLSVNEIHKISQGLVLHYPLSMSGENLIQNNSLAPTSGTTSWSKGGNGWTLSNVTADGTMNGHAIRCTFSGTTGVQGGIHHQTGINKEDMENGQIYTVQARIRASKECIATFNNELMTITNTINLTTEWKIYSYSCAIDNTKQYFSNVIYVRSSDVTDGMWIECEWFKLEIGDKATPWIPSQNDSKYSALGFDDGVIYDVSGFENNGTITGTLTYNTNTPRFNTCAYFNGSSDIRTPQSSFGWFDFKEGTISAWFNPSNTTQVWASIGVQNDGSSASKSFCICNYSGKAGIIVSQFDDSSWGYFDSGVAMDANSWHHLCAVMTDENTVILYVNGVKALTKTMTSISGTVASTTQFAVGVDLPGSNEHFTGYLSDVRFYSTALSEEDVLKLYNTPTSLSRNGTLLTTQLTEEI